MKINKGFKNRILDDGGRSYEVAAGVAEMTVPTRRAKRGRATLATITYRGLRGAVAARYCVFVSE